MVDNVNWENEEYLASRDERPCRPTDEQTYKPKSSSLIASGLCFVRSLLLSVPFSNRCTGCSTIFFFTFCCTVYSIHLRPHSPLHYNLAPCAMRLIHTKIDETKQRRFHRPYSFFFVSAPASSVTVPLTFSYSVSYIANVSVSSSTTLTASSSSPSSNIHSAEVRVWFDSICPTLLRSEP